MPCTAAPWFYPIVDTLEKLQGMIQLGYRWIQLRKKNADEDFLRSAINTWHAERLHAGQKLILNDHAAAALSLGFDGVHLGQEDLQQQQRWIARVKQADKIVGISTHNLEEARAAVAIKPSYIAIGPLFVSATKPQLRPRSFDQSVAMLKAVKRSCNLPTVAIGGICQTNAKAPFAAGFSTVAFINWCDELLAQRVSAPVLAERLHLQREHHPNR